MLCKEIDLLLYIWCNILGNLGLLVYILSWTQISWQQIQVWGYWKKTEHGGFYIEIACQEMCSLCGLLEEPSQELCRDIDKSGLLSYLEHKKKKKNPPHKNNVMLNQAAAMFYVLISHHTDSIWQFTCCRHLIPWSTQYLWLSKCAANSQGTSVHTGFNACGRSETSSPSTVSSECYKNHYLDYFSKHMEDKS